MVNNRTYLVGESSVRVDGCVSEAGCVGVFVPIVWECVS